MNWTEQELKELEKYGFEYSINRQDRSDEGQYNGYDWLYDDTENDWKRPWQSDIYMLYLI